MLARHCIPPCRVMSNRRSSAFALRLSKFCRGGESSRHCGRRLGQRLACPRSCPPGRSSCCSSCSPSPPAAAEAATTAATTGASPVVGQGGDDEEAAARASASPVSPRRTRRAWAAPTRSPTPPASRRPSTPRARGDTRPARRHARRRRGLARGDLGRPADGRPLRAPMLLSDGDDLPDATAVGARRARPDRAPRRPATRRSSASATSATPEGLQDHRRRGRRPGRAGPGDRRLHTAAARRAERRAWSSRRRARPSSRCPPRLGGEVRRPGAVRRQGRAARRHHAPAITAHQQPAIYVLGPPIGRSPSAWSSAAAAARARSRRIARRGPGARTRSRSRASPTATSAGASSTPATGSCSPTPTRPADAAAAAPLSARGHATARCCSSTEPTRCRARSRTTCSTSSPATTRTRCAASTITAGSSGDEKAISVDVQSRIDALLEIQPVDRPARPKIPAWPKPSSPSASGPTARSPSTTCASSWAPRPRTSRCSCATASRTLIRGLPADDPGAAAGRAGDRAARAARLHRRDRAASRRQDGQRRCRSLDATHDAAALHRGPDHRVTLPAVSSARSALLDPARRPAAGAVADGYLDLLGGAGRRGRGPAQRLMLTRGLPVVYERWWRPALGRVLQGPARARDGRRAPDRAASCSGSGPATACSTSPAAPGNFTREFARIVGARGLVVGSTPRRRCSPARSRDTPRRRRNVAYVRGDAIRLPFRDALVRRDLLLRRAAPVRRAAGGARRDGARARPGRAGRDPHQRPRAADAARRWGRSSAPRPACGCSAATRS